MAGSTLTAQLTNNANVTVTLTSTNWPDAKTATQNIAKEGGLWDDNGVWYPVSAILRVTIS